MDFRGFRALTCQYLNLGSQLFDATFRLVNVDSLEFLLLDATEVSISR
jgi:hypothetical protein